MDDTAELQERVDLAILGYLKGDRRGRGVWVTQLLEHVEYSDVGASRAQARSAINRLVKAGLIEEVPGWHPKKYRLVP